MILGKEGGNHKESENSGYKEGGVSMFMFLDSCFFNHNVFHR